MLSYAGIGSRAITPDERVAIEYFARKMAKVILPNTGPAQSVPSHAPHPPGAIVHQATTRILDNEVVLYSGNADGADIAFQTGSGGKCVLFLPWMGFNSTRYHTDAPGAALDVIVASGTIDGNNAVERFHPAPRKLALGPYKLMCRNYHQVMGNEGAPTGVKYARQWPKVAFVVCCADPDATAMNKQSHRTDAMVAQQVAGGTGQAVRIANFHRIPVFNFRGGPPGETANQALDRVYGGAMDVIRGLSTRPSDGT